MGADHLCHLLCEGFGVGDFSAGHDEAFKLVMAMFMGVMVVVVVIMIIVVMVVVVVVVVVVVMMVMDLMTGIQIRLCANALAQKHIDRKLAHGCF